MLSFRNSSCVLALFLGGLVACSGPLVPSGPYAGLSRTYEPGSPSFDARVQPAVTGSRRGIRVDVSAPELSLVFRPSDNQLIARLEWLIRLSSADGRQVLEEQTKRQDITRTSDSGPSLFRRIAHSVFLEIPPGKYTILIQVEDLMSGKMEEKVLRFDLPSRNQPLIATELLLDTKSDEPIIELAYPDTLNAGKAVFYLTGNVARPARLRFCVVRLRVDTTAAQSPYWQGPGSGFSGINPSELAVIDTLYSEDRIVRRGALRRIAFDFPRAQVGTYRAEIEIDDLQVEGESPAIHLDRYFLIRRASFPRLENVSELIPPLVYLADAPEWEALQDSLGTPSARRQFDSFWGRRMTDRTQASNMVRRYFSRVEEANLRYSDFKEGWKTDRGMVFVMLGEPLFVERNLESEIWYYSYSGDRGERTFVFHRVWRERAPDVVEEFLLDRSFEFERFWRGQVERWRRGIES